MTLTLDLDRGVRQICARCSGLDPAGGVPCRDDTGAARVLCRKCAVGLAAACVEAMPGPVAAAVEAGPGPDAHWVRQTNDRPVAAGLVPA